MCLRRAVVVVDKAGHDVGRDAQNGLLILAIGQAADNALSPPCLPVCLQ